MFIMMRLFIFSIVILGCFEISSQPIPVSKIIDSLKVEIDVADDLQSKFKATIEVAVRYTYANPDSTIKYGEIALELAEQIDDINSEIWALAVIGEANIYKANLPKTMEMALRAIERIGDSPLEGKSVAPTYYNLCVIYYEIQDYDNALLYATKMVEISGIDEFSWII